MLQIEEARQRLLAALPMVQAVDKVNLLEGRDRVLAEAVAATLDYPPFDNSSMDGFALRAVDVAGATPDAPVSLKVVGDAAAGQAEVVGVTPGTAVRIMTGARLPSGADAIVKIEDTDAGRAEMNATLPAQVKVGRAVDVGAYIRVAGEDFQAGAEALHPGRRLRPQDIALLAMFGLPEVLVYRQPRVAIFSTGDELLSIDVPLMPGKIRDTNSVMLAGLVESCGARVLRLAVAADSEEAIAARLEEAVAAGVDLILTSAGVSVGAYDFVRPALERHGALDFWRVNMRPGKPLAFGQYRGMPFVGLPGNPVSAFVGFEVFLRPALKALGGEVGWRRQVLTATLAEDVDSDGRASFLRGYLEEDGKGGWRARLAGPQSSGNLYGLAQADALILLAAGVKSMQAGQVVEAWPLN